VLSHGLHLPIQADTVQEAARIQSEFVRTQAEAMPNPDAGVRVSHAVRHGSSHRAGRGCGRPGYLRDNTGQRREELRPARLCAVDENRRARTLMSAGLIRSTVVARRSHGGGSPYTEITQGRGASRAQCSLNGSLHVGRPRSPAAGRINASREEQQAAGRLARDRLLAARHGAGRTSQVPQRLGACPLRAAYARCAAASTAWTTRADLPQYWMGQRE
jgi:hypothetical protein